jgi:hypothetical protein
MVKHAAPARQAVQATVEVHVSEGARLVLWLKVMAPSRPERAAERGEERAAPVLQPADAPPALTGAAAQPVEDGDEFERLWCDYSGECG